MTSSRDDAAARDVDGIARPARFALPDGVVYLDGNSLGPPPRGVVERIHAVAADEWRDGLIGSWNDADWVGLPGRTAARIAPLVGAAPGDVAVADSTSVNLFKLVGAALVARRGRTTVVVEDGGFPTDTYVARGLAGLRGLGEVRVVATADLVDEVARPDVAVVVLAHVDYRSGRRHDVDAVTAAAHSGGAWVLWDLSHSAGALDVDLAGWGADLAVGCTYKFLNGGPGAPGWLWVHPDHAPDLRNPVAGWFGHARPFDFADEYVPAPGAARFAAGTPGILGLAAVHEALAVFGDVTPGELDAAARSLTSYAIELVEARCAGLGLEIASPRDPAHRGAQVSLRHPEAYAVVQALIARGVVGDHRPPDVVRLGFAPRYIRHVDVWDAVEALRDVLTSQAHRAPEFRRQRTVI